jgi:predicted peroxiredoxin
VAKKLVVKLTCGESAPEKASTALSVAAAALASDLDVSFWLSGEAVLLALASGDYRIEIEHAPSSTQVIEELLLRGQVFACSPCLLRRGLNKEDLKPSVKVAGATAFVSEIQGDVTVLVY